MMLGIAQLINEAWSYESNNDIEVALRLYKTAFNNLLDINGQINSSPKVMHGVSPFELRSVADYINHRTCSIQFTLNHPRESITQFRRYIDTFKQHTKSPEYAFEHSAWLSQQYLMFADQFHQAVNNGVKASKAQHPGYYYHEAAMHMIERRSNITEYTNDSIRSNQMPVTNELLSIITTSSFAAFLRQCGWTCIDPNVASPPVLPISPPQPSSPTTNVKDELINYSEIIVRALYKAMEYFEEWSRPRMGNYLGVKIANEYMLNRELSKAQSMYNRSLVMYEKECWAALSAEIKEKLAAIEREAFQR